MDLEGSKPEYDVCVNKRVMVPVRDGIRLAADIYRPAKNGEPVPRKFPAILLRTPYDRRSQRFVLQAEYFARRGYVVVLQDCRGRFESEGEFYLLANEGPDGYDTVEWIARQPWSNGSVGTMGTSYMAWVQTALAVLNPPHLKTMIVNQGATNAYTSSMRQGGAFEMRWMGWAFFGAASSKEAMVDPVVAAAFSRVDIKEWLARTPIKRGGSPLSLVPGYERWLFDLLTHGDYDEFWRRPCFAFDEYFDQHADVPVYYTGSWYDSYARSTVEGYTGLVGCKSSHMKLIMGPWTHGMMGLDYSGDADFGPGAGVDFDDLQLRWFDHWLKGLKTGIMEEPPVKIFVMGGGDGERNREGRLNHGGRWRFESEWPLKRTRYTNFYLRGGGLLSLEPPMEESSSSGFQYDPQNPVPTIGGNISALVEVLPPARGVQDLGPLTRMKPVVEAGAFDQRERPDVFGCKPPYLPLSSRHDVLVFSTEPLKVDLEVTGPITVELWASSSAVDTDFTTKLIDVYPQSQDYPEGYAMNLTDSIVRARYRNSRERAELMKPGEVYRFTVTLYPTSDLFKAGHRVRLDVSSSNFPRFDLNPNTGEPLGESTHTIVANNTVYHDRDHPSHLILPVIPAG